MNTSGGVPAATALANVASSLFGTKFTVSQGYFFFRSSNVALNAAISFGSLWNDQTSIVVGAWFLASVIALAGVPAVPPDVQAVTSTANPAVAARPMARTRCLLIWTPPNDVTWAKRAGRGQRRGEDSGGARTAAGRESGWFRR